MSSCWEPEVMLTDHQTSRSSRSGTTATQTSHRLPALRNRHWKLRAAVTLSLSSLVALQVVVMTTCSATRALFYYCDMTLSQKFEPMAAQLSLKAAMPLTERIATGSDRCSKTGPSDDKLSVMTVFGFQWTNTHVHSLSFSVFLFLTHKYNIAMTILLGFFSILLCLYCWLSARLR